MAVMMQICMSREKTLISTQVEFFDVFTCFISAHHMWPQERLLDPKWHFCTSKKPKSHAKCKRMSACGFALPPHDDTGEIWSGYEWEEVTVCSSFSVVTSMVWQTNGSCSLVITCSSTEP